MGTHGSAYAQPASGEAKQKQAEEHRQEETETSRVRSFKTRAAATEEHGADQSAPQSSPQTATAGLAPQLETPPAAPPTPAGMLGFKHVWGASAPANPIQLPSGLASVSIASRGHLLLAIDKAGALFLSEDRGVTWERITKQWTGRAVEVHQHVAANDAMQTAPAAQNGTTGNSSAGTGAASPSPVSFELSNDKNQKWVSTDGRTWTPE